MHILEKFSNLIQRYGQLANCKIFILKKSLYFNFMEETEDLFFTEVSNLILISDYSNNFTR